MKTTVGTMMINDSLPPELRLKGDEVLDRERLSELLRGVAEKHPERYREIVKTLNDVGRSSAYSEGVTVSLSALQKTDREKALIRRARARVLGIAASDKSREEKNKAIIDTVLPMVDRLQEALREEAEAENNPYWFQVKSGARGKMGDFNAIRGASGLVNDHRNQLVPIPILHSLGEGLDPVEYWAGTYGQRRGMIDVKFSQVLDTQVLTADLKKKALGDCRPGDWIMGSDLNGNLKPTQVVAFHDHGIQETWRYTFRRNLSKETLILEATPDHRMLSRISSSHAYRTDKTPKKRALKEAKVFKNPAKNEYVCVPSLGGEIGSVDEPRALFYGVIAGDGSCGPTASSTEVSQADPLFLAEFGAYMAEAGCELRRNGEQPGHRIVNHNDTVTAIRDPQGRFRGTEVRATARLWLEEAGMWGKLAHEKVLPTAAGTWNNASMAAFIAGYASSDGCVDTRGENAGVSFSICSVSHRLLEGVRDHLLFRWGIHATLSPVKPRRGGLSQTKLSVSLRQSVELFAAAIPLIGQKREQLRLALEQSPQGRLFPPGFKLISAEPIGNRHVADLEVDHPDHLFVLANGLISSNSVGDAGFLNKQLVNAAHRIVVTRDKPPETRLPVGLPVKADDQDNVGAVLARDAGPYKAGETITPDILAGLRDADIEDILVHSPMTEPSPDGGISRWAAGRRDRTEHSHIGDNIGIPAAQSLGERLAQGLLDSKHAAGASGTDRVSRTGFEYLNRLIQSPEIFPEAGPLSGVEGKVDEVKPAPQGGHYISVAGHEYYAGPGIKPIVSPGETVEPGDDLTDGAPHPSQLISLRGIGEARRRYLELLQEGLQNSGIAMHRRNAEAVVAGLLNWVRVNNPEGLEGHVVDDLVAYNSVAGEYKPRKGSTRTAVGHARGRFLEEPVLHHTPGTRITRKVAEDLKKWGIHDVETSDQEPDFEPYMQRGMLGVYSDEDWQTRLAGFYTTSAFLEGVHRGRMSDPHSTSFVPAVAQGHGLGQDLSTTGRYGPAPVNPPSPTGVS